MFAVTLLKPSMRFKNIVVLFCFAASATFLAFLISLAVYTVYLFAQIGHATGQ